MTDTNTKTALYGTLLQKCSLEAVNDNLTEKRLRVVFRLHKDRWSFFLPVLHRLLTQSDSPSTGWNLDVSKHYFLFDNKVRFGWRFIFEAADGIENHFAEIIGVIQSAPQPSRVEVSSMILPGYKAGQVRGGVNARGKGASSVLTPVTGAAAAARIRSGGQ
jgi:hypothetical protein